MFIDEKRKCVEFWDAHWYKFKEGVYYPSVTSVLQVINKGYGYEEWLKNVGHNSKLIVENAQRSGSKIHDSIERFFNGETLNAIEYDEAEWKKLCDFKEWCDYTKVEPEITETELFSENMRIAGTADLICMIDGVRYLIDYKSGNNIYATSHLQVGAYVGMWNSANPDRLIEKAGLLHVGATTRTQKGLNSKGIKFEETDIKQSQKLFRNALAIYDEMFRKEAPMLVYPMELKFNDEESED